MARPSPTSYLSVKWIHNFADEPISLVLELDENRFEKRKIEFFKDGKVGIASKKRSTNGTQLGSEPVPKTLQINQDPQFVAEEISSDEFNAQWDVYV